MAQPDEVNALPDPLVEEYRRTWEAITAAVATIASRPREWLADHARRQFARTTRESLAALDQSTGLWVAERFPLAVGAGAQSVAVAVGEQFTWSAAEIDKAAKMGQELYSLLSAGNLHVQKDALSLMRILARNGELLRTAAGGEGAALAARQELGAMIGNHSLAAVVYSDGSRHGLAEYSEMVLRTDTARGHVEGTLGAAGRYGVEWFEISDGAGCGWTFHEDPDKASGSIRDLHECSLWPLAHPNCRRSPIPRPDITNAQEALDAAAGLPILPPEPDRPSLGLSAPSRGQLRRDARRRARVGR